MALACNSFGLRVFEVVLSLALLFGASIALRYAVQGKVKRFRLFGVHVKGNEANLGVGVFASALLLVALVILVSALIWLDC